MLGENLSDVELQDIMNTLDLDQDGKISFREVKISL